MKINSFFKILNRKINKYDKIATNPFCSDKKVVIVWIEEADKSEYTSDTNGNDNWKPKLFLFMCYNIQEKEGDVLCQIRY